MMNSQKKTSARGEDWEGAAEELLFPDLGHVTLRVWMCSSTWKLSEAL